MISDSAYIYTTHPLSILPDGLKKGAAAVTAGGCMEGPCIGLMIYIRDVIKHDFVRHGHRLTV